MPSLDQLLVQVRRIEQHRLKGSEKQIQKAYQNVLKDLRHYLADEYTAYAEDDRLTYDILQRNGRYGRFLEEVEQKINTISPKIKRLIRSTVDQTYEATYNGMIDCVQRSMPGLGLKGVTSDVIRRAVENPISKLTLNDRLEKHRREIIYDIKQNISVGLLNGDRYSTMAKRIKQSVEGDYKKAICIARTETHRVREAGNHDAAASVNEGLKKGSSGMQMHKTWKTMKDERVRPVRKAKGKARKYDHREMDGVSIPVEDEFELPSGAKTMAPGQSGVAGEDINCRCYLSYDLQMVEGDGKIEIQDPEPLTEFDEYFQEFIPAATIKEADAYARDVLGVTNASYKGVDIHTANEWNQGLAESFQRFPELRDNFGFVGECHERNKALKGVAKQYYWDELAKANPGCSREMLEPYADRQIRALMKKMSVSKKTYAQSWVPDNAVLSQYKGVTVNRDWGKSSDVLKDALKNDVLSKFHPIGCDTIRSVLDHEIGHQLDDLLGISKLPEIKKLFTSRPHQELTEALSAYSWNNKNKNMYSEMIAEAWAEYCNNPNPREVAKAVGETIISEYDSYNKLKEEAKRMGLR